MSSRRSVSAKARAYVLIDTEPGKLAEVIVALRDAPYIAAANMVIGPHDIIALIETPDQRDIGRLVIEQLHGIVGLVRTTTCLIVG
jgi:DNA-binding Lrp family transcriptional regulator